MAKSLNSVNLTGYLGADPKVHEFDDGTKVANLRLAVARSKKEKGEWVDDVVWVDVKAFGGQVEAIETYLTKGSYVAVSGQLAQPRVWEGQDGEKRFTITVDHALVSFGPKVEENRSDPPAGFDDKADSAGDDDIPF